MVLTGLVKNKINGYRQGFPRKKQDGISPWSVEAYKHFLDSRPAAFMVFLCTFLQG